MTDEYSEYVASVAEGTLEMVAAVDVMKEELAEVLGIDHCGSIAQIAKETQNELIAEAFRAALTPFMQPAEEEVKPEEEGEEKETAEEDEEQTGVRQR